MKKESNIKRKITMPSFIKLLKKHIPSIEVKSDKSFKDLTTFKIGGKIKYLIFINEEKVLLKILKLVKNIISPILFWAKVATCWQVIKYIKL